MDTYPHKPHLSNPTPPPPPPPPAVPLESFWHSKPKTDVKVSVRSV